MRYIELKNHLEDLLGIPVDIVTRKALKRQLRDTILSEAIRNWQLRAEDIFESIQNIRTYTEGMDYPTWCEDKKTIDAVVRNFEIIGEAANHTPADIQSRYSLVLCHG